MNVGHSSNQQTGGNMKSLFIFLALTYSASAFADIIQLSCTDRKKVEMTVIEDDVKLKITDLAPYPGRIISGYATVIHTTDAHSIMYILDEYMLRKKKNGYTILQGEGSDLKISFCDVAN